MWPRLSIIAGLLTGVAVAALVIGGILVLAPGPVAPPTRAPVPSVSLGPPSPSPSATASPSGLGAPSASASGASPSGSGASPSGSGASPSGASPSGASPSGSGAALFHVGEPAPTLVVPQVGGGTIDLANLRGKPVWVNFMGSYCPPCVDEFPLMDRFFGRHADDGLVVIAVDIKEDEGTAAAFAGGLGATFPLGLDRDGSASQRWGALALPVHFWIDKAGIIRDGALGGIGPDIMARGLRTIMPGVDVQP
jgi:cytochrome c biogenesis protein CcmG, thiol:disulfide interchange protein DsbE